MIENTFSTEDLPRKDRWASWYDAGTRSHLPTSIRTDHQDDFRGSIRLLDLGAVQVSTLTYSPLQVTRTPKLIRRSDPGIYYFVLHRLGGIGVAQAGREAVLTSETLLCYDTSQPFTAWATAEHGSVAGCVILQVPRKLLPIREETLRPLLAAPLPSREGFGALLAGHVDRLVENASSYTPADAVRLAAVTVDLSAALCAHEMESTDALPAETHRRAMQAQIHEFIRQHLGDPTLSPDTIAAAHRISTRHLYKLFQEQGLAVADWIRRSRLERCRHDLADPALRSRPVLAVAARWGFTDGANFSRAFRAAYGVPPGEYRNLHDPGTVRERTRTVQATTRTSRPFLGTLVPAGIDPPRRGTGLRTGGFVGFRFQVRFPPPTVTQEIKCSEADSTAWTADPPLASCAADLCGRGAGIDDYRETPRDPEKGYAYSSWFCERHARECVPARSSGPTCTGRRGRAPAGFDNGRLRLALQGLVLVLRQLQVPRT